MKENYNEFLKHGHQTGNIDFPRTGAKILLTQPINIAKH